MALFPYFCVVIHISSKLAVSLISPRIRVRKRSFPLWKFPISQNQRPWSRDKEGCTPNSVPMVFIGAHLGILGDNLPINTHYIGISHRGTLGPGVHPTIPWHGSPRTASDILILSHPMWMVWLCRSPLCILDDLDPTYTPLKFLTNWFIQNDARFFLAEYTFSMLHHFG